MAAGPTFTPIATTTLGSSQTSVTLSSIPSTYTDLVLVSSILSSNDAIRIYFNGDTTSTYSYTYVTGDGTSATSGRSTTAKIVYGIGQNTTTAPFTVIANIQNYANTTTYKTAVIRGSSSSYWSMASVGLWRSTSAINSITVIIDANNLLSGSTFTLWGILNA